MNTKTKAFEELKEITEYLQNWEYIDEEFATKTVSLLTGLPSIIMLLADTSNAFPELVPDKDIIKSYLNKTYEILENANYLYPTYCNGLAGYGYLLLMLKERDQYYDAEFDDVLTEINEVLQDKLDYYIEIEEMDILHGALGLGLFFLKYKNFDFAERIVEILDAKAIKKNGETHWIRYDRYNTLKYNYDLGLAHGDASIIYFLSRCIKSEVAPIKSRALIDGCLQHFESIVQDVEQAKSFYPSFIPVDDYHTLVDSPKFCRVAWCYGDLGIFYTKLITSHAINDLDLEKKCIEKLGHVAARRKYEDTLADDVCFCHGKSGNFLMFNNIYKMTGDQRFLEARDFWLEETLSAKVSSVYDKDNVGYSFNLGAEQGYGKNMGLLEGLTGVGTAYLNYLADDGAPLAEESLFLRMV